MLKATLIALVCIFVIGVFSADIVKQTSSANDCASSNPDVQTYSYINVGVCGQFNQTHSVVVNVEATMLNFTYFLQNCTGEVAGNSTEMLNNCTTNPDGSFSYYELVTAVDFVSMYAALEEQLYTGGDCVTPGTAFGVVFPGPWCEDNGDGSSTAHSCNATDILTLDFEGSSDCTGNYTVDCVSMMDACTADDNGNVQVPTCWMPSGPATTSTTGNTTGTTSTATTGGNGTTSGNTTETTTGGVTTTVVTTGAANTTTGGTTSNSTTTSSTSTTGAINTTTTTTTTTSVSGNSSTTVVVTTTTTGPTPAPTAAPTPAPTGAPQIVAANITITIPIVVTGNVSLINITALQQEFAAALNVSSNNITITIVQVAAKRATNYNLIIIVQTSLPSNTNVATLNNNTLAVVNTALATPTSPLATALTSAGATAGTPSASTNLAPTVAPTTAPTTSPTPKPTTPPTPTNAPTPTPAPSSGAERVVMSFVALFVFAIFFM